MDTPQTIIIDLLCDCGTKCGTLEVRTDHPAGTDLKKHGIEKVECDACREGAEKPKEQSHQ
jgi:hypothetical protein